MRTAIWDKAEQQAAHTLEQYGQTEYKQPLEKFMSFMLKEGRSGDPPERIARHIPPLFPALYCQPSRPYVGLQFCLGSVDVVN